MTEEEQVKEVLALAARATKESLSADIEIVKQMPEVMQFVWLREFRFGEPLLMACKIPVFREYATQLLTREYASRLPEVDLLLNQAEELKQKYR